MSQRLLVTSKEKDRKYYDGVCHKEMNKADINKELLLEWCCYYKPYFLRPWKIRIEDIELFENIEPLIKRVIKRLGKKYPDDIWGFFIDKTNIWHPSQEQLDKFIKQARMARGLI